LRTVTSEKPNDRYTSFGILLFQLPKDQGEVGKPGLRLVPSIPGFAKDGKLRFLLAETRDPGTGVLARLRLDPKASGGIGQEAFKAVHPLGSGSFTKVKTGRVDQFDLKPDQAGRIYLRGQLKAGAAIVIVVVPDDEEVAATSFEAGGEPQGNWPRLVLEFVVSQ